MKKEILMDTEYVKFYEKKLKVFILLLGCVVFISAGYFLIQGTSFYERLVGYSAVIFFGLCFIKGCFKLFNVKAYIEMTPTGIKIDHFERLLWTDIVSVKSFAVNGTKVCWFIEVKDVSKYKLTFLQKLNLAAGYPPFCIALSALSQKDKEKIKQILKERISQNDLN
jgi:hypothetical protein